MWCDDLAKASAPAAPGASSRPLGRDFRDHHLGCGRFNELIGADNGLALGTFYGYVCKVKRALIYNVPLSIAERATSQELQKAQQHAHTVLKDTDGTQEEKMSKAYQHIKMEQVKEKERLKVEADKNGGKKSTSIETPFTLPDPNDYEVGDEDSDALLKSGIQSILTWLQTKNLQLHLAKKLESAKVLKTILAEIMIYENQQEKEVKKVKVA